MNEQKEFLTSNISFKTIASQKAEYDNLAKDLNIPTGEWARSIIEQHKFSYGKSNEPTEKEALQKLEIEKLKEELITIELVKEFAIKSFKSIEDDNKAFQNELIESKATILQSLKEIDNLNKVLVKMEIEKEHLKTLLSKVNNEINIMISGKNIWSYLDCEVISKLKKMRPM